MLHGQVHDLLSRALPAVVLAACVLAVGAGGARADVAQVTVVAPGGAQQTLSLDALAGQEDVQGRPYVLRSAAGESAQTVTGFSLAKLLEAADADPYGFSYLEVQRPAGGAVLLSRHQALDPGAFPEGPPVAYATASGTGFLRPSSSSSSEDLNADDSFEAPQGITLVLRKDSPLRVVAKASPLRTRPGQPVSFEAVVERAGAGEQLAYSWYFDDGHSAAGASVEHGFAKRGSYDVVVGVTTPGDSAGTSAVVTVQVGAPLSGPNRKGGGRNHEADAPDHGAATGTPGAAPGLAASPESGVGVAPTDAQRGRRPRVRRSNTDTAPRDTAAGEPIVGELVSATTPIEPAKPVTARTGQLDDGGDGPGLPGAAVGVLVTVGLLGAGALIEARGLLR